MSMRKSWNFPLYRFYFTFFTDLFFFKNLQQVMETVIHVLERVYVSAQTMKPCITG